MYIIFNLGVSTWLLYGLMLDRYPIVIANVITLSLTLTILLLKLTEGRRQRRLHNNQSDGHVVI